ncbi:hypothetical protein BU26DRAFT_564136 [Trematosphaeria pertusa]|uniref:Uncharacterized protein n=1 Tax=Trematosphaeria pertusa TaxID=390896 RepID=A0A6A6II23_9PLEO|nr:uncharacterized protein BU26DRAFT_564136 [Trematosphaeria pertusa]KAF2250265.1 hypothetical protein BU26DRAFT_564136 [Trematosphaeria pertusa]
MLIHDAENGHSNNNPSTCQIIWPKPPGAFQTRFFHVGRPADLEGENRFELLLVKLFSDYNVVWGSHIERLCKQEIRANPARPKTAFSFSTAADHQEQRRNRNHNHVLDPRRWQEGLDHHQEDGHQESGSSRRVLLRFQHQGVPVPQISQRLIKLCTKGKSALARVSTPCSCGCFLPTTKAKSRLSAELFEMDGVVDTLYQILTGVSLLAGTEDEAENIYTVVRLACCGRGKCLENKKSVAAIKEMGAKPRRAAASISSESTYRQGQRQLRSHHSHFMLKSDSLDEMPAD